MLEQDIYCVYRKYMKDLENKDAEEWISRLITEERGVAFDAHLTERIMNSISEESPGPGTPPLYSRSLQYLIKAACIAAAIVLGIYLGNLYSVNAVFEGNSEQAVLHDGYIEGIDVLLNKQ